MYVGIPATYTAFVLSGFDDLIPATGGIQITFPDMFTLPSRLTFVPNSGISSSAVISIAGNTITITNGAPYSQSLIAFGFLKLTNMTDGITAHTNRTENITVKSIDGGGQGIDSTNVTINVMPAPLAGNLVLLIKTYELIIGMSFSSSSSLTSELSTLKVEFNTTNSVPANAQIKIKTPVLNPLAPLSLQSNVLVDFNSCAQSAVRQSIFDIYLFRMALYLWNAHTMMDG